jgi:hypothetical protein
VSIESAVCTLLLNDVTVSGRVEGRVFPNTAPLNAPRPYLTYTRVSGRRPYHLRGTLGKVRATVQVDCQADDYDTARAIMDRVKTVLAAYRGTAAGVTIEAFILEDDQDVYHPPTKGEEVGTHRVSHDYFVAFDETALTVSG